MNFYIFSVKNSYLIYVLLKNSNFFGIDFYNILHISLKKILKFTLK